VNFIQKQIEASERLFNVMMEDHKERTKTLQMWIDMNEAFQKKLAERDKTIAELRERLAVYETVEAL
jgi:hypothetical protein